MVCLRGTAPYAPSRLAIGYERRARLHDLFIAAFCQVGLDCSAGCLPHTVQIPGDMRRRGWRDGMVTMCAGGQGAATIFENLQR